MAKRLFDIVVAATCLFVVAPLMLIAMVGIRLSSPGPVLYRARRGGCGGHSFDMLKFRTMHVGSDRGTAITAPGDRRVFRFGAFLRRLKIDELPQFLNILRGDMSIVGPRPEDPDIIERYYVPWMKETLSVRPGITSPGAIFNYSFSDLLIDPDDPEGSYVERLMPPKLALERAYMDRATMASDLLYIGLTAKAIVATALGHRITPRARDIEAATKWVPRAAFPNFP